MNNFQWTNCTSVEQALGELNDQAVLKAGGVDLLDLMKEKLIAPRKLVNLRTIPDLDQISDDEKGGLRLGPMVTLARLDTEPAVRKRYAVLADAAGHAATPQIRNMATVAGNLVQRPRCWYFRNEQFPCRKKGGEVCYAQMGENQYHAIFNNGTCAIVHPSAAATALVALGATLELTSAKGKRQLPIEEFFILPTQDVSRENVLRPDEMITQIRVPAPPPGTRQVYVKQGEKESFDWPIAELAIVLQMDGETCRKASIIMGAAAPVPRRARAAETALASQPITEQTAQAAAKAALADASPMTRNGYKVPLFENLLRRTILQAAKSEGAQS